MKRRDITLSSIIATFALFSSVGGFWLPKLYRGNEFVSNIFQGNDLVTLFVAVPIFIGAMLIAIRGSLRAKLIWLAMLDFMLYNYAYYLFGTTFNKFFLLYVILFILPIIAIIFALIDLDVEAFAQSFSPKTPVKWISGFMLFTAISLSFVYILQSINFILTGELPVIIETSGHITSLVFALDLSLVVPVLVIGAIWLWQRKPWGYILASISLIKGTLYNLVLGFASWYTAQAGFPAAANEIPLWASLCFFSLVASIILLSNLKSPHTRVA